MSGSQRPGHGRRPATTTSLFAFACLLFVLVGPAGAFLSLQRSALPGAFADEAFSPGQEVDAFGLGPRLAVWGSPAELDRSGVTCTDDGTPVDPPDPATATVDGTQVVLLADVRNSALSGIECSGGGLESVRVSGRTDPDAARTMALVCGAATIVLPGIGLALRRAGHRWPV